jgi:uncharacterized membrane protein YkvA (DUF1232 family)
VNTIATHDPLPLRLPQAQAGATLPAGLRLADAALLDFNCQLHGVHDAAPQVEAAQIEGLAAWLQSLPPETMAATIELRMARAESLRRMLDDADWEVPADVAVRGRRLVEYIHRRHDLIPDDLPQFGHLDDALLVELSWSEFEGEVRDYLDYRRWCARSPVRGSAFERRAAWEAACLAEASALIHRQEVRARGYSAFEPLTRSFRVC